MSQHKYVYLLHQTDSGIRIFADYLIGYNQGSLGDYVDMAAEMRKVFKKASLDEFVGGNVSSSPSLKGFTLVRWSGIIPNVAFLNQARDKHGWFVRNGGDKPSYRASWE